MKRIAVVILNYNGAEMLQRFLPGVIENSEEATVYVADNGSTDNSAEVMKSRFPDTAFIAFDGNYGFAEGYNKALAQVEEQYVVLLNSDVKVSPHWLAPLLEFMDANPEYAACQPKILSYRNMSEFEYAGAAGGFIDKWGYPYCRGRIFGTVETDRGQYDTVADVFWATGAALMVRRDDYVANGGLDARFFAHMEEIDLCWRLRSHGRKIACVPQSYVFHIGGATLKTSNPKKTYLNFRNNLFMLYKNTPPRRLTAVMAFRRVFDNVAALKFLLCGDVKSFMAVRKARNDFKRMRAGFRQSRNENMQKTTTTSIPEMNGSCILWQYYVGKKHKYSQLS
jgi:GT2 family glycosyltransferase